MLDLILGDMETEDVLPYLYDAYQREETLFVRSDYLKAMAKLDYRPYLERLKDRMVQLQGRNIQKRTESIAVRNSVSFRIWC